MHGTHTHTFTHTYLAEQRVPEGVLRGPQRAVLPAGLARAHDGVAHPGHNRLWVCLYIWGCCDVWGVGAGGATGPIDGPTDTRQPNPKQHNHNHQAVKRSTHLHVGEVEVDEPRHGHEVRHGLDTREENVVGEAEGVEEGGGLVHLFVMGGVAGCVLCCK